MGKKCFSFYYNLLQVQEINDKLDIDSVAEQKVSSEEKSRSGWYQVSREHLATSFWSSLKFSGWYILQ